MNCRLANSADCKPKERIQDPEPTTGVILGQKNVVPEVKTARSDDVTPEPVATKTDNEMTATTGASDTPSVNTAAPLHSVHL